LRDRKKTERKKKKVLSLSNNRKALSNSPLRVGVHSQRKRSKKKKLEKKKNNRMSKRLLVGGRGVLIWHVLYIKEGRKKQ